MLLERDVLFFEQYSRELFMWHLGSPKLLLLSPVKVPVCPLTGVYARNVPAPDLPCEHHTPALTLPSLPMPQLPGRACFLELHALKPGE